MRLLWQRWRPADSDRYAEFKNRRCLESQRAIRGENAGGIRAESSTRCGSKTGRGPNAASPANRALLPANGHFWPTAV